jgi:nucleoside-diphosphate-sugar epimerase
VVNLARAKAHGSRPLHLVTSVNVNGARIVAHEAATAGARLIHASSTAVYGSRLSNIPANESAPLHPDSAYARSKIDGEEAVAAELASPVILRISAILGPRCLSWLPLFHSIRNGTFPIVGDGRNVHHPVDVDDVVSGIMLCIERADSAGTFNIAGPEPLTMREMVRLMARAAGSNGRVRKIPRAIATAYSVTATLMNKIGMRLPRSESVLFLNGHRSFDISRAGSVLGFHPDIQPPQAIERTAAWYRSQGLL